MKGYTLLCTQYYVKNGIIHTKNKKINVESLKEIKKVINDITTGTRWVPYSIEKREADGTLGKKYDITEHMTHSTAYKIIHELAVSIGYIGSIEEKEGMVEEIYHIIEEYGAIITEGDSKNIQQIIAEGM